MQHATAGCASSALEGLELGLKRHESSIPVKECKPEQALFQDVQDLQAWRDQQTCSSLSVFLSEEMFGTLKHCEVESATTLRN
jgi:hypothetical protein